MAHRWHRDGPDYYTGHQTVSPTAILVSGAGGIVLWMRDGRWMAEAWTSHEDHTMNREYRYLDAAKRAVERWLDKHGG